ncbi:MAG: undecaprenyl-phosphate glucose phosphotransferase [Methyloligellaceae bacterium]
MSELNAPGHATPELSASSTEMAARAIVRRSSRSASQAGFGFEADSPPVSPIVFTGTVRALEFLFVVIVGYVVFLAYVDDIDVGLQIMYLLATIAAAGATTLIFQAFDLYNLSAYTSFARQFARLGVAWTIVFATLVAIAFFVKIGAQFSRVWLASWYLFGISALFVFRLSVAAVVKHLAHQGRLDRRAVILGGGPAGEALIKALEASRETDIRICGVFDDRSDDRVGPICAGYPKLGNVDELVEFGRRTRIDLLIMSLPLTAENRLLQVLKKLWILPVDIRLSAHTNKLRFRPRAYSYIGNVPFIDIFDKPIADWDHVVKWVFDRFVTATAVLLSLPVMALVALAIKIDSRGPVLFKQKRYGFNNELIEVYKFRSMYVDQSDQNASKLVTKDDPRVTRVGRFIRKTSLDELPQLFNVLTGGLSLVGPRPHAMQAKAANALYNEVVDGYFARHRVKPGITGWAQINGWRGETDTQEKIQRRVEHDLYYIENWSVLLDLYIVLMTPFALLKTENAY